MKRVLDKDEEIKFSYRPNKKRFIYINVLASSFTIFLFFSVPFILGLLGLLGVMPFVNDDGSADRLTPIWVMLFGCFGYLFALINFINSLVRYNKTIYVITNKKVLIRTGFIGADFISMNISSIGLINVRVDFLDKLVKPNTGTIDFANASAPVVNGKSSNSGAFSFAHINNPYDAYQEIKDYIDSVSK